MDRKPAFAPFSFSAPAFAAAPNPFMAAPPADEALVAEASDVVWSNDTGDADETSAPTADALDVRILWGTTVLLFEQMSPPRPFRLGGAGSDFILPELANGEEAPTCSLIVLHGDDAGVLVPKGATVDVKLVNGQILGLATCLDRNIAHVSAEPGAFELTLPHGATATMKLQGSDLVFEVTRTRARQQPETPFWAGADLSGQIFTGLSAFAHASVIGALAFFLPAMHDDDAETVDRNAAAAMRPYLEAIAEKEPEQVDNAGAGTSTPESGATKGSAADKPEGKMGSSTSTSKTPAHYAIKGEEQNPQLAKKEMLAMAANFGMIGILNTDSSASDAPSAPWATIAAGSDARNANGGMWTSNLDDALGADGLGLSSDGEGGGGKVNGLGLDHIGTVAGGTGSCTGAHCGTGPGGFGTGGHPNNMPGYKPHGPQVRPADFSSNGTLARDVIQRVVRQNFGRFRLCYEEGLRTNPGLSGRVAVDFVIARDGTVASSATSRGTEMSDPNVVSCVVRGFHNLEFPAPTGGQVMVTYPLVLSPGE
jgi:hypothetical protein